MKKLLFLGYILAIIGLFLYSFTQIDLSLTLSQVSVWQGIQKGFQQIGYFQRPLSTLIYISLVLLLSVFYLFFLNGAYKKEFKRKDILKLSLFTAVFLTFSYNAFSYDLFNYIFDAKIITFYHQNPYFQKALDYMGDPMLSFMQWTHRTYPYGPSWLLFTVPLSYLGLQFFLPTFFLFKALSAASYFGTVYFIGKIAKKLFPERELEAMIFFALNPLVIVETLVSAHNDSLMLFLAVLAIYFIIQRKFLLSSVSFVLSVGIKFVTAILLPAYFYLLYLIWRKKPISWESVFLSMFSLMALAVVLVTLRTNFQPWYFLYVLPFAAFLTKRPFVVIPSIVISIFSLFQYVPFLYLGNWNPPVPTILFWLLASSLIVSVVLTIPFVFTKKTK